MASKLFILGVNTEFLMKRKHIFSVSVCLVMSILSVRPPPSSTKRIPWNLTAPDSSIAHVSASRSTSCTLDLSMHVQLDRTEPFCSLPSRFRRGGQKNFK